METIRYLIAVLLLWLPWTALLAVIIPAGIRGRYALLGGYGMLLGLLSVPVIMRMLSFLGLGLSFFPIALSAILIPVSLLYIAKKQKPATPIVGTFKEAFHFELTWANLFFAAILILIGVRIGSLILEVMSRPLFPWDATMHWATKARVWFEHGDILPFVDHKLWLDTNKPLVFTDRHPDYPITIPLLQTWISLAIGRWNESLMNIPWLMCYFSIGLIFYGQLRFSNADRLIALSMTYMLLSMPLLNAHVALAGYADMFMGASFGAAVMALYHWSNTREPWQAVLLGVTATGCLLIKNEGLFWVASLLPGIIFSVLPHRRGIMIIGMLLLLAAGLLIFLPQDILVAGNTLQQLDPYFRPESIGSYLSSLFVQDNWHFLSYLFLILVPVCFIFVSRARYKLFAVTLVILGCVGLHIFLFLFTKYGHSAVSFTAVNRLSLQLVPAIAFVTCMAWTFLRQRS